MERKDISQFFKSITDQNPCPVVICNVEHEIIYMNPAAVVRYAKRGGAALVGQSILVCHNPHSGELIKNVVAWFQESAEHNILYTYHNDRENKDVYMVALRDEDEALIGYYEKHEYRDAEKSAPYDFGSHAEA